MMRRAMEGQRVFGMCGYTQNGACGYGTLLRIEELQMLPDGRSLVTCRGVRKFRIVERGELDGYLTGQVEFIDDDFTQYDPQSDQTKKLMVSLKDLLMNFLNRIPPLENMRLGFTYGQCPEDDPIHLPYWIVSVLTSLGIPGPVLSYFYVCTCPIKRLERVIQLLSHLLSER
jgi:Lon protease-like protein